MKVKYLGNSRIQGSIAQILRKLENINRILFHILITLWCITSIAYLRVL